MSLLRNWIIWLTLLTSIQATAAETAVDDVSVNNREVEFAERVIVNELISISSLTVQESRAKCGDACAESGALEMGIGLLGLAQKEASLKALVGFLALRLDGAGSEVLNCQLLKQRKEASSVLKNLDATKARARCEKIFRNSQQQDTSHVSDVRLEQICRAPNEIQQAKEAVSQSISSKTQCQ